MYELRSTRVRTDRVLSVPGTDFLCRLPPVRPQIASIPARLGQVPGTDFQSGRRLLASRRVLGQVSGVLGRCLAPTSTCRRVPGRCLAPTSTWHRFPPGTDLAAPIWPPYRYARVGAPSYASWAGAWHRLPVRPQIAIIPPRPGQVPGTDLAALSIRSGRSPKLQWIRRVGCLAY